MQNTNNFKSNTNSPEPESLPVILGGFAYDRSDITGIINACNSLSEELAQTTERLKLEDPQSQRADLYLLAMSALLHETFRKSFEAVNFCLFPSPDSPEEAEQRMQAVEKFEALLDDFNIGLGQCVSGVRIED